MDFNPCITFADPQYTRVPNLSEIKQPAVEMWGRQIFDLNNSWFPKCCSLWGPIKHEHVKFQHNLATSGWVTDDLANFCQRYVMLWPWPLTPYLDVLRQMSKLSRNQSLYQIWVKSNNPQLRYWRFRKVLPTNIKGAKTSEMVLRGLWANCTKFREDIGPSSLLTKFVLGVRYLVQFHNAGRSKSDAVENWSQLSHLWLKHKLRSKHLRTTNRASLQTLGDRCSALVWQFCVYIMQKNLTKYPRPA